MMSKQQLQSNIQMRENRPFNQQEDQLIRNLYEQQNIKKWSIIARVLTEQHHLPRNAKQCRDRYQQHLDPMMVSEWTEEDEQKLYLLHNEIGNKWAVIAQKFPGRTDNCVKNHFYSKLRKSLRHLNKVIKQNFKKQFKELKIAAIYKIIEALEDRFNENTSIDQQAFLKCIKLKKELLEYANADPEQIKQDFSKEKDLIIGILDFSKNYKKKTKKQRRNSLNGAELFKPATFQKRIKYCSDQESSESEYSFVVSHKEDSEVHSDESEIKLGVIEEDIRESMNSNIRESLNSNIRESMNSKHDYGLRFSHRVHIEDDPQRHQLKMSNKSHNFLPSVEEILREKNVLEEAALMQNRRDISNCSLSLQSDSEKQDMFEDNLRISEGLRNIEEMDEESPEENLFRSQR